MFLAFWVAILWARLKSTDNTSFRPICYYLFYTGSKKEIKIIIQLSLHCYLILNLKITPLLRNSTPSSIIFLSLLENKIFDAAKKKTINSIFYLFI